MSLFEDSAPVKLAKILAGNKRFTLMNFNDRKNEILEIVLSRSKHKLEGTNFLANLYGSILHKSVMNAFKVSDKNFNVLNNCNSCDKCINECPRKNIKRIDNSLKWNSNCELCFGCMVRCPQKAIEYKEV